MNKEDYIKKYTEEAESNICGEKTTIIISKSNKCYLTHKSLLKDNNIIDVLSKHEITLVDSTFDKNRNEYTVANIGYSEKENKWYGWSHRAIFGFTIGSKIKKGDCAYNAPNKEDFENSTLSFWKDEFHDDIHIENRTEKGFDITWIYSQDTPNKKIRGKKENFHYEYPIEYGHGEWTAKTLEDAKQMAIDFANNIA